MGTGREAWEGSQDRGQSTWSSSGLESTIVHLRGRAHRVSCGAAGHLSVLLQKKTGDSPVLPAVREGDEGGPLHISKERNLDSALPPWELVEKGERQQEG